MPYIKGFHLEAEDRVTTEQVIDSSQQILNIVVPVFPHIANHTDLDALRLHPQVNLQFVAAGQVKPEADIIILAGSKSVQSDLDWLKHEQWQEHINKHLRYGGKVIGICGGYQMLGKHLHDPNGIEGPAGSGEGLSLLDFETTLETQKQLTRVDGNFTWDNSSVSGYEIHMGISKGPALNNPAVQLKDKVDGVISEDGQIMGNPMIMLCRC